MTLLFYEQQLWTEIGETEAEKDRMLLELERECLEIYRKKVDEAANAKARLHQSIAAKEAEIAMLMATLGELNVNYPVLTRDQINDYHYCFLYMAPRVLSTNYQVSWKLFRIKVFACMIRL